MKISEVLYVDGKVLRRQSKANFDIFATKLWKAAVKYSLEKPMLPGLDK